MPKRVWYEIWFCGKYDYGKWKMLARVRSKGLSYLVYQMMEKLYKDKGKLEIR